MRPITDVLVEFPRALPAWPAAPQAIEAPAEAPVDPLLAAREAGWADGFAFGEAERDKQRAAAREDIERELAAAREGWAAAEGAALADALRQGLDALAEALDAAVAAALLPAMAAAQRERVAAEVADAVGRLLRSGAGGALIELRGPADLVAPVREAFAGQDAVLVVETGEPEVRLTAGDTGAVSQLAIWSERLRASLEAPR